MHTSYTMHFLVNAQFMGCLARLSGGHAQNMCDNAKHSQEQSDQKWSQHTWHSPDPTYVGKETC